MEEEDSVPLHLLQPQRDLAANWSVDVARELQAYLEQLARVFDDGNLCNFAKAALVLQGSTQVYSRKVEYLYNLVLQALDVAAQKGKAAQQDKSSQQADGSDADVGEEDDEADFFCMDVPEMPNIDLDDVESGAGPSSPALKPPACLLVVEGDSRDSSGEAGELAAYQLVTSILHRDFLLLDPRDTASVDLYLGCNGLNTGAGRKNSPLFRTPRGSSLSTPGKKQGSAAKARTPRSALAAHNEEEEKPEAFDSREKDPPEAPPWPEQADTVNFGWPENSADHTHDDNGDDTGVDEASSPEKEKENDPWAPLNPHKEGSLQVKPYKKGQNSRRVKPPVRKRGASSQPEISVATVAGLSFPELGKILADWHQESEKCDDPYGERYEQLRASFMVRNSTPPKSPTTEHACDDGSGGPEAYDVNEDGWDAGNNADDFGDVETPGFPERTSPPGLSEVDAGPPVDSQDGKAQEMSFEDLCQAHVDSIFLKLEDFEERTELATRVSTWKRRIDATLDEQESRTPFDIHVYGERLLGSLSTSGDEAATPGEDRPFADLVQGQDSHEVARAFSALLQLVNNRNVDIRRPGSQQSSQCYTADDCFCVTMLTARKQHEELLQHMAPASMETAKSKVKKKGSGRQALHNISNTPSPAPASASLGKRRQRQSSAGIQSQRSSLSGHSTTPPARRRRPSSGPSAVPISTPGGLR